MDSYVEAEARPARCIPCVGAFIGSAESRCRLVQLHFDAEGTLLRHSS